MTGSRRAATTLRRARTDGPAARRPLSLLVLGDGFFAAHPLPDAGELVVGRGEDSDILVDDPSVSRRHARLRIGETLSVEDLGSANGTRVGDAWLALWSTRNRSPSRSAIAAVPSAPRRPAASSRASGRPSRRQQIRATSIAFSALTEKPGETAAPRSTNSRARAVAPGRAQSVPACNPA